MKKFLKFITIMSGIFVMSLSGVCAVIDPIFVDFCKKDDKKKVKESLEWQIQNRLDVNSPGEHFLSPLAVAAEYDANKVLSYLIGCSEIDINKNMVIFFTGGVDNKKLLVPLFFGLVYRNNYDNLRLLLDSSRFDINSLKEGLIKLKGKWQNQSWELDVKTKSVLENSKYREHFKELISSQQQCTIEGPKFVSFDGDLLYKI